MSTIPDRAIWFIEDEVKDVFVDYSLKRVASHLEYVEITYKELKSFKSFLGIKYNKEFIVCKKKLNFSIKFVAHYKGREFIVECAIDIPNMKVYWKTKRIYGEGAKLL